MSNIATKEQLDRDMYELAKVTAGIQKAEAVFQEKLDDITAKREQATSPFQILKERLEAEITTYVNKKPLDQDCTAYTIHIIIRKDTDLLTLGDGFKYSPTGKVHVLHAPRIFQLSEVRTQKVHCISGVLKPS